MGRGRGVPIPIPFQPPTKKMSPFIRFALKKKREMEAKGHIFPLGLSDVIPLASEEWSVRYLKFVVFCR